MIKKIQLVLIASLILMTGCQRGCQKFKRKNMTSSRDYEIIMYSGGDTVYYDRFHGVVTEEEGNGAFYYKKDTMIELSGDYILKSY
jgi:hypothetical protein